MARTKITAYVTPDIAETLKRVAAIDDRSVSDIIEDAVARRFASSGREAEHAALMAKLDQISRRIGVLEKGQETHFELSAQAARFTMSLAPEIADRDRAALSARGADRFRNLFAAIIAKLASGRSAWRDALAADANRPDLAQPGAALSVGAAAE